MMPHHNLYHVLGIDPSLGCRQIDDAVRHVQDLPDLSPEHARDLHLARLILGDPGRRARYDAALADPRAPTITPMALEQLAALPGAPSSQETNYRAEGSFSGDQHRSPTPTTPQATPNRTVSRALSWITLSLDALILAGIIIFAVAVTGNANESTDTATDSVSSCASTNGEEALDANYRAVPVPESWNGVNHWAPAHADVSTYDPCSDLSWIILPTDYPTSTSPAQIMFFHEGRYIGTATPYAYGPEPTVGEIYGSRVKVVWPAIDSAGIPPARWSSPGTTPPIPSRK